MSDPIQVWIDGVRKSSEEGLVCIKDRMDKRYASGSAYSIGLPFDAMRLQEIRKTVLQLATPECNYETTRVLDVGCGNDGIAVFWPHQNIVGLDISEVAIRIAKERHPKVNYLAIPIEKYNPAQHGYGSFRMVVAVESIEHWMDVDKALDNIRQSMILGGWLVLTTPNTDSLHLRMMRKLGMILPKSSPDHLWEFGFQDLIHLVEKHGFALLESKGVGLCPYIVTESNNKDELRGLTDLDPDVNRWMNDIGRAMPPEYAFTQCHRFVSI